MTIGINQEQLCSKQWRILNIPQIFDTVIILSNHACLRFFQNGCASRSYQQVRQGEHIQRISNPNNAIVCLRNVSKLESSRMTGLKLVACFQYSQKLYFSWRWWAYGNKVTPSTLLGLGCDKLSQAGRVLTQCSDSKGCCQAIAMHQMSWADLAKGISHPKGKASLIIQLFFA